MEDKIQQQIKAVTKTTMLGPTGPEIQPAEQVVQEPVAPAEDTGFVSTGMTRTIHGPRDYSVTDTRTATQQDEFGPVDATSLGDTSGTTRPLDGSNGSPYYLDTQVMYPTVEPYTLHMPDLGLEFRVSTLNPFKAAYEAATRFAGVPREYYTGYYYTGPRQDTFWEATKKSVARAPGILSDVLFAPAAVGGRALQAVGSLGDNQFTRASDQIGDWLTGVWATKERFGQAASQAFQLDSDKSGMTGLLARFPEVSASIGTAMGLMALGVSPQVAGFITEASVAGHIADSLEEQGFGPGEIFVRSVAGGALAGALGAGSMANYRSFTNLLAPASATAMGRSILKRTAVDQLKRVGMAQFRQGASVAAADFAHNTLRRWANRGASVIGKGGVEFAEETAQSLTQSYFSAAISPETWRTELDNALGEGLLGLGAGLVMASPDIAAEYRMVRAEKELAKAVSEPIVRSMLEERAKLVERVVKNTAMTQAQAEEYVDYATDHVLEDVEQKLAGMFMGEINKFSESDKTEFSKRIAPLMEDGGFSEKQLLDLDSRVESAVAGVRSFSASDTQFLKGLFRGLANILAYAGVSPSSIRVPTFTETETEGMRGWYDPDSNTFNINPMINAYGVSLFDTRGIFKPDAPQNTLSPRHRAILHEFAHYMDIMVGVEGFGRFFEQYYATIRQQVGWQKSVQVRNIAEQSLGGDRTSPRPKTASATHPGQTTEYFAESLSRATAEQVMKAVGAKGKVADFVAYANLVINGLAQAGVISSAIREYMASIQEAVRNNSGTLKKLVESQLTYMSKSKSTREQALVLQGKLKRFLDEDVVTPEQADLSVEELSALVEVLNGFLGGEGIQIAKQVFDGVDIEALNAKATEYLQRTFDDDEAERQKEIAEQQKKEAMGVKRGRPKKDVESNDLPIFSDAPAKAMPSRATGFYVPEQEAGQDVALDEAIRFLSEDFGKEGGPSSLDYLPESPKEPNKTFTKWEGRTVAGRTLNKDLTESLDAVKEYSDTAQKTPMLNWMASTNAVGTVDMKLQAVGGKEFAEKYGIVHARGLADQYKREQGSLLEKDIKKILVGEADVNSMKADVEFRRFILESKMKSIEAEQINAADPSTTEKVSLSPLEVMSIYATLKQKATRANERIDKQYVGKAKELVAQLTPMQKKVADAILKNLHDQWPTVKDAINEELGERKFETIENYMPLYDAFYSEFENDVPVAMRARSAEAMHAMRPIIAVDMMQVFDSYTAMAGRTVSGFRSKVSRLRSMLRLHPEQDFGNAPLQPDQQRMLASMITKSERLHAGFEKILGKDGTANLIRDLDDLMSPNVSEGPVVSNAFDAAVSSIVSNAISLNFLSWPKNFLSNFIASWNSVPNYFSYLVQTFENLGTELKKTRDMVPAIADRFGGGAIDERLNAINTTTGGLLGLITGKPKFFQYTQDKPGLRSAAITTAIGAGMFRKLGTKVFMQHGDAMGLLIGLTPMRLYLESQGHSDAEIADIIGRRVEQMVSTSNTAVDPKAVRSAKRSAFGGALMFTKDVQVKGQSAMMKLMEARRGEVDAGKAGADIALIGLSLLAFSAISGAYWDLGSEDEEVKEAATQAIVRDTIQTLLGMISPIAGLASSTATYALGYSGPSGISTPAYTFTNNFVRDIKNGEIVDVMTDLAMIFTGASGLPRLVDEGTGFVEAFLADTIEERKAAIMQAVGYSENMAEKRAGLK